MPPISLSLMDSDRSFGLWPGPGASTWPPEISPPSACAIARNVSMAIHKCDGFRAAVAVRDEGAKLVGGHVSHDQIRGLAPRVLRGAGEVGVGQIFALRRLEAVDDATDHMIGHVRVFEPHPTAPVLRHASA